MEYKVSWPCRGIEAFGIEAPYFLRRTALYLRELQSQQKYQNVLAFGAERRSEGPIFLKTWHMAQCRRAKK